MIRLIVIIAISAIVTLATQDATAQRINNRRTPIRNSRPPISPYVTLFRGDNGGLNSLYGFYRPRDRTLQFANEATRELQYQRDALSRDRIELQREIDTNALQSQQQQQTPQLQMRPSGSGVRRQAASFMGHSRYFPGSSVGGRQR
ncbi:MAG: hypothetical protein GY768_08275 [Planctomycetaceae bacterium]|nr:hypothetical protein [Planctomycetaceae bacterium]